MPILHHATEEYADDAAAEIDESLWWMVGRRAILARFLDQARHEAPIRRILDIGCGSGGELGLLSRYGVVSGVEQSATLARRARSRGVAEDIHEMDILQADPPAGFDLYCMFDVLEHIEDDEGMLRRIARSGRAGGHQLLLSVPACPALYGPHDRLLHHYRRYSLAGLEGLLQHCGYRVVRSGYFAFFVFPFVAAMRLVEKTAPAGRTKQSVNLGRAPKLVNGFLTALMRSEARLSSWLRFPFGVWAMALARKVD